MQHRCNTKVVLQRSISLSGGFAIPCCTTFDATL